MVSLARNTVGYDVTDVPSLVIRYGQPASGIVVGAGARIVAAANDSGTSRRSASGVTRLERSSLLAAAAVLAAAAAAVLTAAAAAVLTAAPAVLAATGGAGCVLAATAACSVLAAVTAAAVVGISAAAALPTTVACLVLVRGLGSVLIVRNRRCGVGSGLQPHRELLGQVRRGYEMLLLNPVLRVYSQDVVDEIHHLGDPVGTVGKLNGPVVVVLEEVVESGEAVVPVHDVASGECHGAHGVAQAFEVRNFLQIIADVDRRFAFS